MQNFFANAMPGGGQNGPQDQGANSDVPWWMKYAGKGAGIVGGLIAMFFGLWATISLSPYCIVAGIWQILAGFALIVCEAPFCCMFIDQVQKFSAMMENRPPWQKGLLYLGFAIPPMLLCGSLTTIIGSSLVFTTGVIYGMMTLGKKASREEMSAAASGNAHNAFKGSDSLHSDLVSNIHGQDVEAAKAAK